MNSLAMIFTGVGFLWSIMAKHITPIWIFVKCYRIKRSWMEYPSLTDDRSLLYEANATIDFLSKTTMKSMLALYMCHDTNTKYYHATKFQIVAFSEALLCNQITVPGLWNTLKTRQLGEIPIVCRNQLRSRKWISGNPPKEWGQIWAWIQPCDLKLIQSSATITRATITRMPV